MPTYQCQSCNFKTMIMKRYVLHCKLHSNTANQRFCCGIPGCTRQFSTYSSFKSHITRLHAETRKVASYSSDDIKFACPVAFCKQTCSYLTEFLDHLKSHVKYGTAVFCPFVKCKKAFSVLSSFKSHLFRAHRHWTADRIEKHCTFLDDDNNSDNSCRSDPAESSALPLPEREEETVPESDLDNIGNIETPMLNKLALFLLKLESKCLVPASTVQLILDELADLQQLNAACASDSLSQKLKSAGISNDIVHGLLHCVDTEPLSMLLKPDGPLHSDHLRKTLYRNTLNFVPPVAISLGIHAGKEQKFHYVPIRSTLQTIFQDSCIDDALKEVTNSPTTDKLRDFSDGSLFKNHDFFKANPDALQIVLFQDAFEVVNPLGSARGKHKVLGVYYTLGNLLPAVRSRIDALQLLILCTEKNLRKFGPDVVFKELIKDLKSLETEGVDLGIKFGNRKGAVVSILGDNLGSHTIGGFVENFSGPGHFCRYCLATNDAMAHGMFLSTAFERRTPELFNAAVLNVSQNALANFQGVKRDSIFNSLLHYHVCSPGLPPCLGHDLFEGVVPYDLTLFLAYFVNVKKWFTFQFLNRKIELFTFRGPEARDRPAVVNVQTGKIVGHAVQVWNLLRFLPFFIGTKIDDTTDSIWQLLLVLRRLVELVCSPVATHKIIADMQDFIEEYLQGRVKLFPKEKLKPKHHFLSHYPFLTITCGPLIRLWTLRFESKHSYFKKCLRSAQNFKNVTYTMSNKHQLLQAMYSAGSLFRMSLINDSGSSFHAKLYGTKIQLSLASHPHLLESGKTRVCDAVVVDGLEFKTSSFVFMHCDTEDRLFCGEIVLLLVYNNSSLYAVCNVKQTLFAHDVGLLEIIDAECDSVCKCVLVNDLLDAHPYEAYNIGCARYIAMRHAF